MAARAPDGGPPTLRHPDETDHPAIAAVIDEWFGGRRVAHLAGRSWFRHAGSTSWIALEPPGRPIGILLGYLSQDHPDEAVVQLVAVDPNRRRRGIGRQLVEAFVAGAGRRGARHAVALAWPGEPPAAAFFRAAGFSADDGPGSRNIHGAPAFKDHEAPGDDRIVFRRPIGG
ncbi:MAG TPA: GNAT family N-acetyltransferase [Candidatus Limnocylindrales bacterium]|nr:GNAT family N-acetyltransferase [Candidatus Limnocylindrales bacterium]